MLSLCSMGLSSLMFRCEHHIFNVRLVIAKFVKGKNARESTSQMCLHFRSIIASLDRNAY